MTAATIHFTLLLGSMIGGIGGVLKVLWNIKGAWDQTNSELHGLIKRVDERDGQLERRLDQHERWHVRPPRRWL